MTMAIKIALYFVVSHTLSSARSNCFAPKFCPIKVAAALLRPQAGNMKKIKIRNAICAPAEAKVPPDCAIRRVIKIQLPLPIRN
ncbi:hypothetical protein D3C72_2141440 [compost metagenome]